MQGPWRWGQLGPRKPWGWRHQGPSRGPREEVQAQVIAKSPGTPALCLLATAGLPREGASSKAPVSLEELGEGSEEGQPRTHTAVSVGAAAEVVPEMCYLLSPPGSQVHKGAPEQVPSHRQLYSPVSLSQLQGDGGEGRVGELG